MSLNTFKAEPHFRAGATRVDQQTSKTVLTLIKNGQETGEQTQGGQALGNPVISPFYQLTESQALTAGMSMAAHRNSAIIDTRKFVNTETLILWNPTANGDGNVTLYNTGSQSTHVIYQMDRPANSWYTGNMGSSDPSTRRFYNTLALDTDIRASYPSQAVRSVDARLVVSANFGGGYGDLHIKALLPHMFRMTPREIIDELKSDAHDVKVKRIGYDGKSARRLVFHPWLQSRKAFGEWTEEGPYARPLYGDLDPDEYTSAKEGSYSDQHPFGGYVMCFPTICPAAYGALPSIQILSRLDVQILLKSSSNHLRSLKTTHSIDALNKHHLKDKPIEDASTNTDAMKTLFESSLSKTSRPQAMSKAKTGKGAIRGSGGGDKRPTMAKQHPGVTQQLKQLAQMVVDGYTGNTRWSPAISYTQPRAIHDEGRRRLRAVRPPPRRPARGNGRGRAPPRRKQIQWQ